MRFCRDGRSRRIIKQNVRNVEVCRFTGMQALCVPIRAAKYSQGEWNFEVQGRMSDVSRERGGNIVQSEL